MAKFIVTGSFLAPKSFSISLRNGLVIGEMEIRIKEQMSLFAGRMSAETMRANQLRLYLSAMAHVLVEALR